MMFFRLTQLAGVLFLLLTQATLVAAQTSPASPARRPDSGLASTAGLPLGQGPGYHSPQSPIKPLPERRDVLAWALLTDVRLKDGPKGPRPRFSAQQLAWDGQVQRVQGFMMPLEPGARQKHFLLTSVPLTCAFCVPGGPESMVEVYTQQRIEYTQEPVVVEGRLSVLADDPYGLFYRIQDGQRIP